VQPSRAGVLQVEPTDHCNLSCGMCAPHHEGWSDVHGVPKGALDPELWFSVVDGLARDGVGFDHLIFQWLGEPTLHPRLAELVGHAARHLTVDYLRVDTNALLLGEERGAALLSAVSEQGPPLLVVLSIDAHTAPVYARVKGRDALERVRRNVRTFLRRRRHTGARVNVQLQFVVQEGNAHEAGAFLRYWADLLACQGGPDWHDEVLFKRLSVGGGAAGQAAADALYERTTAGFAEGKVGGVHVQLWHDRPWQHDDAHHGPRGPCAALWLTPVIRHDGHLQMCCADMGGELDLGSLREHSFSELWNGPRAEALRQAHRDGRFEGVCAGCGGINWYEAPA